MSLRFPCRQYRSQFVAYTIRSSTYLLRDNFVELQAGDFTPRVLGSVVAADILGFMQTDGWNHLGEVKSASEDQNIPDDACTANCRPYSDTTGYQPKNSPWNVTDPAGWQPLIESDGNGFFYRQVDLDCIRLRNWLVWVARRVLWFLADQPEGIQKSSRHHTSLVSPFVHRQQRITFCSVFILCKIKLLSAVHTCMCLQWATKSLAVDRV